MSNNRNYRCKSVDMLRTSKTIATNFNNNIAELSTVRTNWTAEYATGLLARIDDVIQAYLGIDPKKDLRSATATLKSIMVSVKRDISLFKLQIDEDFKSNPSRRNEILNTLGKWTTQSCIIRQPNVISLPYFCGCAILHHNHFCAIFSFSE